jgi:hypothetical protein
VTFNRDAAEAQRDMRELVNESFRQLDRRMRERIFSAVDRDAAEARGVAWLKSCLSPEQLADYDRTRSFDVIGHHTGNRYRICWGTSQNIIRLETSIVDGLEKPAERLYFGPRGVPIGDILLHQKIALEGDEEAALRIAGRTPVPITGYAAVSMGPDGRPVHVDSNGQPAQVGMQAAYAAQNPGQVGQQRLTDPDRAGNFGWNAAGPQREEFGWNVAGTPDPGQPID